LLFSCNDPIDNCGTIDSKYEKDGKYYFSLILKDASTGNNENGGRVYGDVSVSKTVFQLKNIGDNYCILE
tara:strand:- start:48 stop:257 length:210 start_codon:yes stop_codon:yes gene_type:complete